MLMDKTKVHLIGIAGTGLSAIARILLLQGYQVSGSDLHANTATAQLAALGATIYQGHHADYIKGADWVIRSSAIKDRHVEVQAARTANIPVYKRSDKLAQILAPYKTLAVAGTHGKTTTTSMIVHTLTVIGQSPSYIVGGIVSNTGKNADVGTGDYFIIEADEYDHMFHGLRPQIAVITSLDYDHPDFFTTPAAMYSAFAEFANLLPSDGMLIACIDDADLKKLIADYRATGRTVITYGFDADADWRISHIRDQADKTSCDIIHEQHPPLTLELAIPGKHNLLNALATLIVAQQVGSDLDAANRALAQFQGAGRRFDIRATINDIIIIDDYAHHPTAIKTTLDAARQRYPQHQLWAIWQPHTFSRTQTLWDDYLTAFQQAQHLIITEIYPSREKQNDFPTVRAADFVRQLAHESKFYAPTHQAAVAILQEQVRAPSVILIMSAGDAPQIGIIYQGLLQGQCP